MDKINEQEKRRKEKKRGMGKTRWHGQRRGEKWAREWTKEGDGSVNEGKGDCRLERRQEGGLNCKCLQ